MELFPSGEINFYVQQGLTLNPFQAEDSLAAYQNIVDKLNQANKAKRPILDGIINSFIVRKDSRGYDKYTLTGFDKINPASGFIAKDATPAYIGFREWPLPPAADIADAKDINTLLLYFAKISAGEKIYEFKGQFTPINKFVASVDNPRPINGEMLSEVKDYRKEKRMLKGMVIGLDGSIVYQIHKKLFGNEPKWKIDIFDESEQIVATKKDNRSSNIEDVLKNRNNWEDYYTHRKVYSREGFMLVLSDYNPEPSFVDSGKFDAIIRKGRINQKAMLYYNSVPVVKAWGINFAQKEYLEDMGRPEGVIFPVWFIDWKMDSSIPGSIINGLKDSIKMVFKHSPVIAHADGGIRVVDVTSYKDDTRKSNYDISAIFELMIRESTVEKFERTKKVKRSPWDTTKRIFSDYNVDIGAWGGVFAIFVLVPLIFTLLKWRKSYWRKK